MSHTNKKQEAGDISAETIRDVDYIDDLALLANALVQAEMHSPEEAARAIGFYANTDKI